MNKILIGANLEGAQSFLNLKMANRHGLIAGATGTGKTVTLQVLAEGFAKAGVPVFLADIKGDLSGISTAASPHPKIDERIQKIKVENYSARAYPTLYWDVYGKQGHNLKTTISEMGPLILSRLMALNDTQESILHMAFKIADDQGLLLLDTKDLKSLLKWMSENTSIIKEEYGNVSTASLGSIQRQLLVLNEAGADLFFQEPAVKLEHLMQKDFSGNGVISILNATQLVNDPRLYSTVLLWLLSELFEELDEVGDPDKPRLVFFFDEAHLLFNDIPKVLLEKIEQVVRLIRSKGVGIYFVTQNPLDIPETVLGQLGNRIQHALRAYTPKDQKAVKVASQTFRQNANLNTEEVITQLGVGEALVSFLDEKGTPTPVERALICPPESKIGPSEETLIQERIKSSPLNGIYDVTLDRESAFEILKKREEEKVKRAQEEKLKAQEEKWNKEQEQHSPKRRGRPKDSIGEAMAKSFARSLASAAGRRVIRGILGSIFGGR